MNPGRPRRGGVRCDVAAAVADELIRVAEKREADAHGMEGENARVLFSEAAALRSVVFAIRTVNVQP